ncbi:MAG: glucosyltransferase domain-containing protein [Campylobacter sp.]|nr:glucosyltransferase domain-containing protein [Campylobacter sp.]
MGKLDRFLNEQNSNISNKNIVKIKQTNKSRSYIYFLAITRSFFKDKNFLKHFGFVYLLYFIGFFKFLITDALTLDDQSRLLYSYTGFSTVHRYLSEILSYIFNMNYQKILYISPLTQLIAIVFLSIASLVLVKIVNKKISYWGLLASATVGLSPFYLECISFKFDSPYMALATLCTILPFLFAKRLFVFFMASVILLLCMWNLYQANNGIYIVLSMFITLNLILQKAGLKQILKFIFVCALAFIISVLIYKFIFIQLGENSSYATRYADYNMEKLISSFKDFMWMANRYIYLMDIWIGTHIIKYLFFISCVLFLVIKFLESKINYLVSIASILFFLFFGFFATFGLYYLLLNLNWLPRFFCGTGVFVAVLLITITNIKIKHFNYLSKIYIFVFIYNLIIISTVYINAKIIQTEYVDFRINQTISFLENNFQNKNYNIQIADENLYSTFRKKRVSINNNVGFHPAILNMVDYIPLSGNSAANFSDFFNSMHRAKNIKATKCMPQNQKPTKTINTKLNKFEVYENNCIVVTYTKISTTFDIKFEKSMIKYKEAIFEANLENLQNSLTLSISKDMRKKDYGIYGVIFEFNQDISNFIEDKDNTILSIQTIFKNIGNIAVDKNLDDFKKIGNKFYYILGFSNADPNDIEKIYISFFNKNTRQFSQRFLLDLKELSKK